MNIQKVSKEEQAYLISEIQHFFYEERDEEIGELAAGICLEFIKEKIAPVFYNHALEDAKKMALETVVALEENILSLECHVKK